MAEVTVSELATSVGASVERLLAQMKDAGLTQLSATDAVSDEEKQTLLGFLKTSHGESTEAPKKITLKRKTISTLKTGSGSGRKTVNVEVRKKRTYVKRDQENEVQAEASDVDQEALAAQAAAEAERVAAEQAAALAAAEAERALAESAAAEPARVSRVDDVELIRQAASGRRKAEEEELRLKKAGNAEAKKEQQKAEADKIASQKAADAELLAKKAEEEKGKHGKKPHKVAVVDDEDTPHKKPAAKVAKKGAGPKKGSKAALLALSDDGMDDDRSSRKRKKMRPAIKLTNNHGFKKPAGKVVHEVELSEEIVVSELAQKMNVKAGELIKRLMKMGEMVSINQAIDLDTAQMLVEEMGHTVKLVSENAVEEAFEESLQVDGSLATRAPVVTVMGHVDHGKTSLLDYIRKAKVAAGEAGGITQHIGAYRVQTEQGEIAFLDTPGHAAFTAMRARGAQCTDVVILVVAADDGVMPQTEEAILHSHAAGVPIVVAINKCDKESADPDRVKNELSAKGVIPEDWGGDTQFIEVSAHTGDGVDRLLEAISLQAELLELQAASDIPAKGVIVESRMDKGRGVVATVLVQDGTLRRGDMLLAGQSIGRVRAMVNEFGKTVTEAGPSTPVEVLGLDSPPDAGDEMVVVSDERKAKGIAEMRAERERSDRMKRQQAAKLENMFAGMEGGQKKILSVVVKADVRGSLEALLSSLAEIGNDEVQVNVISSGVGGITENDVNLAITSGAIVLGFNVRAAASTRRNAEQEGVEIRYYSIIYQLLDEVKAALSGMLDPERIEEIVGIADVREVFRSPKFGQVAGCMVVEGTVYRSKPIRVLRDNIVIYEGELESLRRFKDDVENVRNGVECGIGVKNYDVKVGDQIEVFDVKEVAREL